jgi:hypothetical protein
MSSYVYIYINTFFATVVEVDELDVAACIIISLAFFLAAGNEEESDDDDLFLLSVVFRSFASSENFVNHLRNASRDI